MADRALESTVWPRWSSNVFYPPSLLLPLSCRPCSHLRAVLPMGTLFRTRGLHGFSCSSHPLHEDFLDSYNWVPERGSENPQNQSSENHALLMAWVKRPPKATHEHAQSNTTRKAETRRHQAQASRCSLWLGSCRLPLMPPAMMFGRTYRGLSPGGADLSFGVQVFY